MGNFVPQLAPRRLRATAILRRRGKRQIRALLPFFPCFALFAAFDVAIQGLASRAFGVTIDWWALARC